MKIDILGESWTINVCHDDKEPRMTDADGFCDETTREIFAEDYSTYSNDPNSKKDLGVQARKVLRHEIVHAFLKESGLAENSEWAQNEEMVDWIAIQGPKIVRAWKESGAL